VDRLEGPEELKRRLRVLLETIVGTKSVVKACEELGVSESRLHDLRREALVGALGEHQPRSHPLHSSSHDRAHYWILYLSSNGC
jgi:transposase-like protein